MERASHESKNPRHQPETQLRTIKAIEFEDAIREYLPTQIELKNIGVLTYEQTEADVRCTVEYRNKQNKTEKVVISAKEVFENFTQKHIKSVAMFGDSFIISFEEAKKIRAHLKALEEEEADLNTQIAKLNKSGEDDKAMTVPVGTTIEWENPEGEDFKILLEENKERMEPEPVEPEPDKKAKLKNFIEGLDSTLTADQRKQAVLDFMLAQDSQERKSRLETQKGFPAMAKRALASTEKFLIEDEVRNPDGSIDKKKTRLKKVGKALLSTTLTMAATIGLGYTRGLEQSILRLAGAGAGAGLSTSQSFQEIAAKYIEEFKKLNRTQRVLVGTVGVGAVALTGVVTLKTASIITLGAAARHGMVKVRNYFNKKSEERLQGFDINELADNYDKAKKEIRKIRNTRRITGWANYLAGAGTAIGTSSALLDEMQSVKGTETNQEITNQNLNSKTTAFTNPIEEATPKDSTGSGFYFSKDDQEYLLEEREIEELKIKIQSMGDDKAETRELLKQKLNTLQQQKLEEMADEYSVKPTPSMNENIAAPTGEEVATETTEEVREMPEVAIVKKGEGITHAFKQQIQADPGLGQALAEQIGYEGKIDSPAFYKALGEKFGYINEQGQWIGVKGSGGDTAYQFEKHGDEYIVTEYHKKDGVWMRDESHEADKVFEGKDYEKKYEYFDDKPRAEKGETIETPIRANEVKDKIEASSASEKAENETPYQAPKLAEEKKEGAGAETFEKDTKKEDTDDNKTEGTDDNKTEGTVYGTERTIEVKPVLGRDGYIYDRVDSERIGGLGIEDVAKHYGYYDKLTNDQINYIGKSYKHNLEVIFGKNKNLWLDKLSKTPASKLLHMNMDKTIEGDREELSAYIKMLSKTTGLKPFDDGYGMNKETAKDYIARALVDLESRGKLSGFNERFDRVFIEPDKPGPTGGYSKTNERGLTNMKTGGYGQAGQVETMTLKTNTKVSEFIKDMGKDAYKDEVAKDLYNDWKKYKGEIEIKDDDTVAELRRKIEEHKAKLKAENYKARTSDYDTSASKPKSSSVDTTPDDSDYKKATKDYK